MDSNKRRGGLVTIEQVIGYWGVEERVEADFARARRRAMFRRVSARLRGDRDRLVAFDEVRNAQGAAAEALALLEERVERFVVHFDVDVIDFVDFPISDVPQHNAGLTYRDAMGCLEVFAESPNFAGLTITEFNPDHTDEEGVLAAAFASGVAAALARRGRGAGITTPVSWTR